MRTASKLLAAAFVACATIPALAAIADATGTWTWTMERQGQSITTTLKLKQDGDKLTGTISGRNNTETPIEEGKVDGDKISFQVKREFQGNSMIIKYHGTVEGDVIKGKTEVERDGQTRERDWEAKRGS
jgi:hypothetical protein